MKKSIALTSLFIVSSLFAAEADHYTVPADKVEDVAEVVNAKANDYLSSAVEKANLQGSCDEKALYETLRTYFGNHSKGQLAKDLLYDGSIARTTIPLEDSIYGEWSVMNGYLLGRESAKESPLALAPLVKVGDQVVGTDKFEHMFGMGFNYFKRYYQKGHNLVPVLKYGVFLEKTILGGNIVATGVFAYADLAANFNGMRFWNHMLLKEDDILGKEHNLGPYISCENGSWQKVGAIDFRNYMDESMDESLNCSKLAAKKAIAKLESKVSESKSAKINLNSCYSKKSQNKTLDKYNVLMPNDRKKRKISDFIINKKGHGKVSYFNEL